MERGAVLRSQSENIDTSSNSLGLFGQRPTLREEHKADLEQLPGQRAGKDDHLALGTACVECRREIGDPKGTIRPTDRSHRTDRGGCSSQARVCSGLLARVTE